MRSLVFASLAAGLIVVGCAPKSAPATTPAPATPPAAAAPAPVPQAAAPLPPQLQRRPLLHAARCYAASRHARGCNAGDAHC